MTPTSSNHQLAQMLHRSAVASWLVHVVGRVLAIAVGGVLLGLLGAIGLDAPWLIYVGLFASGWLIFGYLNLATAPYPSTEVIKLLDAGS